MLGDYIQTQISDIRNNSSDITFSCLSPDHPDRNPSMFVDQRVSHIAHCRSCGASYNIFQAHHLLEGAPLYGRGFLEDNVNKLAVQFGIDPIDIRELTEDEIHKFNMYQVHLTAADILSENKESLVTREFTSQLGISDDVANSLSIGTVLDTDDYIQEIANRGGWTVDEVEDLGIRPNLFGPTKISYTLHDKKGRPIAFATRDLRYDGRFGVEKQEEITDAKGHTRSIPKWCNSSTSVIYNKADTLYGYHYATKSEDVNKIYVVEGYGDAAVMWSYGIRNVVCVGSTAFSPKHVQMLKDAMVSVVIICLDNDEAGLAATDRVLEEGFTAVSHIKAQVLQVPPTEREDGKMDVDPDSYIRAHDKDAFLALTPESAFQYTLNRIPDELDSDEEKALFVERFIPIVMNETSAITQQAMRKAIANRIGVSEHLIKEEQVNREKIYNSTMRDKLKNEFKLTSRRFYEAIDLQPDKALPLITEFRDKVNNEMNSSAMAKLGMGEVCEGFENWKSEREQGQVEDLCFKTGFDFIDNEWGGIPKRDTFMGFTGPPNMGKSALLMNFAVSVLSNNDPTTTLVLYWTIDDNKYTLYDKMSAIMSRCRIYDVNAFNQADAAVQRKINKSMNQIEKWIKFDQCLSVKDQDIGKSGDDCKNWVLSMKEKFPDKDILLVIDNFANMSGPHREELQNEAYNIEILHDLRTRDEVAIISSFEVNKEGSEGRFTNKGQRGSQSKMFRQTLNFNVYNELGEAQNAGRTAAQDFWTDSIGKKMPVIETTVSKNKLNCKTGFKGKLFWKFVPYIGYLECIGEEEKLKRFKTENHNGMHRDVESNWSSESAAPPPPIAEAPKFTEPSPEVTETVIPSDSMVVDLGSL